MLKNIMTIDLEEWFYGLKSAWKYRQDWKNLSGCAVEGTSWLLEQLAVHNIRATFFVVGTLADQNPQLITNLIKNGHEIALHGYSHKPVFQMQPIEFKEDLNKNISTIRNITGETSSGYRSPWFSISNKTPWFWEILAEQGIVYDSSVFPIRTPLYGMPGAPRNPFVVKTKKGNIIEYPISTIKIANMNFPFSGGFYFRALPYFLIKRMVLHLNKSNVSVIFYFHPWEFVPDHHSPSFTTMRERVSHYAFLENNRNKFARLIHDFRFDTLKRQNLLSKYCHIS